MKFGILKDIKFGESRVIATPAEVSEICRDGHEVYVASGAGYAAGFDDEQYARANAIIVETNEEIQCIHGSMVYDNNEWRLRQVC